MPRKAGPRPGWPEPVPQRQPAAGRGNSPLRPDPEDVAGFTDDDTDELVFTDEEGGPLRYSNRRRRVWLPAASAAGCAGAGFHDPRRLNATTVVVEGIDVKTAQTRLGHADPRTTLAVYASAPASIDLVAADVIGERFFGEKAKGSQAQVAGTKSPRHFRAKPSEGSGTAES